MCRLQPPQQPTFQFNLDTTLSASIPLRRAEILMKALHCKYPSRTTTSKQISALETGAWRLSGIVRQASARLRIIFPSGDVNLRRSQAALDLVGAIRSESAQLLLRPCLPRRRLRTCRFGRAIEHSWSRKCEPVHHSKTGFAMTNEMQVGAKESVSGK